MKIGIIASDRKEWHIKQLQTELEKRRIESHLIPVTKILSRIGPKPKFSVRNYALDDYDGLIIRRVPGGTAEQVFYRMDTLRRLEDAGVMVINSARSIEKAVDKFYTSSLLEEARIPTPRTLVSESFGDAMNAFDELGGDIIVKPLFGSLGMGIARITDKDTAYRVFRALEMTKSVYYLQEYIPHPGEDIRVFIIGGEIVASMKRVAVGWRTNISSGGKALPYKVTKEVAELSLLASEALDLEYTGVDIILSDNQTYIIELNSTPGWEGLQTVTDINISEALVNHIVSKLE